MDLSPHFDTHEFDCHNGAPVPRHAYLDLRDLARVYLEPLRKQFGATIIVSGYRTPAYNASVGGAPHSYHVYEVRRFGAAADVVCAHGTPAEWLIFLSKLKPGGLGGYSRHVHVDNREGAPARW